MVIMDKNKWDFQMKLGEGAARGAVGVGQASLMILVDENIWSTLGFFSFDLGSAVCRSLGFDYYAK